MKIALLQLPSLAPNDVRLGKYLQNCKKQKVQIAAFSEYVFQPFYRDIDKDSKAFQSSYAKILKALQKLSLKYKLDLLVPLLVSEDKKLYKSITLIEGEKVRFYHQQRLIAYSHWNEKQFFDNPLPKAPKTPLIFEREGLKIAVIAGFEMIFDEIWLKLKLAQVDVVFIPCSHTFDSNERWRAILKSRTFCNSMAILRINSIQKRFYDDAEWNFYGDSCFFNADGQIGDSLDEHEGMMIVELQAQHIKDIQEQWGFR